MTLLSLDPQHRKEVTLWSGSVVLIILLVEIVRSIMSIVIVQLGIILNGMSGDLVLVGKGFVRLAKILGPEDLRDEIIRFVSGILI
jgi:hypothetical protein